MNVVELVEIIDRVSPFASQKERDFLQSAKTFLIARGNLTTGQLNWAQAISEKYSATRLEAEKEWSDSWTDSHRNIALQVAAYYRENPPYFSNYVERVFSDPGNFTLSKKEWDKFCENKYAKKIRKEYESEPKFAKGQCIQIRKTNKLRKANYSVSISNNAEKTGFIIAVDAKPIVRAAKGSRIYQVLLAGESRPIFAHESDLKTKRGKK